MSVLTVLLALTTFASIALLLAVEVATVGGAAVHLRRRISVAAGVLTVAFVVLTAMRFVNGA